MDNYKLPLSIFLFLLISLTGQTFGDGVDYNQEVSVTFEESLTLTPKEGSDFINSETSLILETSISGVDIKSETAFGEEGGPSGLSWQTVSLAYHTAELSTNFNAVFDPPSNGLNYLIQQVELNGEKLELSNLLLLEYVSQKDAYGAGFETKLAGKTVEGSEVSAAIRFGMDKYLKEVHDPTVRGSGYYIITEGVSGPSQFPFGSALIEVSDVGLGPCTIANRTKFMREEGLLFSGFSFDLVDKGPLRTRGYVYFTAKEKTITLVPTFQFEEGVWNVVADFGGEMEGDEDSTLDKLVIRGVKFSGLFVGNLEISGTSALGGKMKKEKGADQLELHSKDYKLVRSFDEIARDYMFEKVDWSDVITLEYEHLNKEDLKRYLALDWYLKRGGTGNFFGMNTFDAVAEWELSPTFSFGTGVSFSTDIGLERVVLNIIHDF